MRDGLIDLIHKMVEVLVRGGITYRGTFIEASEDTIHLKSETGWVTIPMEKVISVKEEGSVDKEWRDRDVDPSFFRFK